MSNKNQSDIQLRIIAAIDGLVDISKLITEVDKLGGQTTESSVEVEKLVSDLDKLRQQDQLISKFQQLKAVTVELESTLDNARTRATALGKGLADSKAAVAATNSEYKASMSVTQQLSNEWVQAKAKVDLLSTGIKNTAAPTREQRDELKKAKDEAKALGEQYRASAKETTTLASALRSTESAVTKQTKEFNSARKEVNQLDAQYEKQNATLNSLRTTLQQTGVSTTQLVSEQIKLKSATAQAEIGVENLSASLREQAALHKYLKENVDLSGSAFKQNAVESKKLAASHTEAGVASNGFASNISGLTSRLLAMASAYVGINTITSAIKEMFSQGNQAELLQIQMNAVMGSIQAGEQATAWIQKFAKETPLQLNEVTQAFTTMKSFGLDPMDGSLQMVVDQSFKLGKGFEGVQRISLALGQAWAKQKLQGEEIMQLVEAGVPVWDMLAKATGKNTYELQRLSEQGNLGRKVIKQLMDEIGNGAAGAAAANMGTLSGLISNAKDNLDTFYRTVAESGAMDWLKTQLSNLNTEFDKMSKDGRLTKYAKQVSDYLVTTAEGVKGFVLNIGGSFDGVINATNVTFQSLRIVFNTFTLAIKSAVTIAMVPLVGFAKMLDGMATAAEALGLDGLASKLRFASGAIKAEFDAFAAAAKEDMNDIADASSKLSADHKDATDAMKKSMQDVSDKSDSTSKNIIDNSDEIKKSTENSTTKVGEFFSKLGIDVEQASGRVGSAVGEIHDGLTLVMETGNTAGSAITEALSKGFDSAKNRAEIQLLIDDMELMKSKGQLTGDDLIKAYGSAAKAAGEYAKTNSDGYQIQIGLLNKQKAAAEEAYKTTHLDQYKVKMGEINTEIDKATKAQQKNKTASGELEQAYSELGMKSAAALEDLATKAEAAYNKISTSGSASLDSQKEAFLKYAEAEIKAAEASGRVPAAMLQSQAAALGLSTELEALTTKLTTVGGDSLIAAGALDQLGGAAQDAGDKVADVGSATEGTVKSVSALKPLVVGLGAETINLGKSAEYAGMSVEDLTAEIEKQSAAYQHNMSLARDLAGERATLTGDWLYSIEAETAATNRYYLELAQSTLAVKNLQTALSESPSETLINRAEHALSKYKELGDENLSGLRSAIDSARSKMDSLNASTQSTLNSLRDQADELNNNTAAIENRRYQTQVAELEAKLAEAEKLKNAQSIADMKEALRLAQEIHNQKLATIKAEQAASKQSSASSSNSSSSASSAASTTTAKKEITIKLAGKTATVTADAANESALDGILAQLESAGALTSS